MDEDDQKSPPIAPTVSPFRRFHQRRGVIVRLDQKARLYWQSLVAEGEPLAQAAVDRAYERYARNDAPVQ
jgi:hypothetical protein